MTHELIEFFMILGYFCRGIFKLLVKFQLENKDNPSYTGTHILKTLKRCTDFHLNFMILMFYFHCVQGCHSKISTSVVERHSWLTLTSLWGLSWLSSETTNWYGHARYSAVSIIPSSHSVSQLSASSGVSHLHLFPWFFRVEMEWSTWWSLWTRTHWQISWRTKRVTEKAALDLYHHTSK